MNKDKSYLNSTEKSIFDFIKNNDIKFEMSGIFDIFKNDLPIVEIQSALITLFAKDLISLNDNHFLITKEQ